MQDYTTTEQPWYAEPKARVASAIDSLTYTLWQNDAPRRREYEKNTKRFRGASAPRTMARYESIDRDNIRMNLTKAAIETLMSKVGTNRARPRLLTSGANYSLRVRVKKTQTFLDAIFKAQKLHRRAKGAARDAMLAGTGTVHFYPDVARRTVACERVLPHELLVDHDEGLTGNPQNLVRVKYFDPELLKVMYPRKAEDLARVETVSAVDLPTSMAEQYGTAKRLVRVSEAWHLAVPIDVGDTDVSKRYHPGRRVLSAGNVLLADEPWGYDYFPFSFIHWCEPTEGFWGDSAAAEIRGLEREANVMLQRVSRAMKLSGQVVVLTNTTNKLARGKITDEIMSVLEFSGGTPPTFVNAQPVHPQLIDQVWALKRQVFEQLGTNEAAVSATKPAGIESGRALEQLSEDQAIRFKDFSQNFEEFVAEDMARQVLRCARDLDKLLRERGVSEGYVVRSTDRRTSLKLRWKDVAISPDDLFVESWPTSTLPQTPAAKTQEVERWQTNGWITPQRAMALLELPDLESESDIATADCELFEYQLEQMLDGGKNVVPLERQNLQYALQRGTYAMEAAVKDEVPMDHIDCLSLYLDQVQAYLAAKKQAEAAQMVNPGMGGPTPLPGPSGAAPMMPTPQGGAAASLPGGY